MIQLIDDLLPVERGLQLVHRLDEEIHVPGLLPLVSLGNGLKLTDGEISSDAEPEP
jgi:hypothetical protein